MRTPHRFSMTLAAAALVAAASASAQQAPDRSKAPQPGPAPEIRLPSVEKRTLSNGMPVLVAGMHEVPVVQVSLVVSAGAGRDPSGKFGLASLTAAMLDEGAATMDALEIADSIDFLGASLSTGSAFDSAEVSLWVPLGRLDEALSVMADVAMRPTFPEPELERLRKERLTSLLQARDDPASIAEFAFPQIVFGRQHRYGTLTIGLPPAIASFTVEDLRRFHSENYGPGSATLIVAGDVSVDGVLPLLEKAFGAWKRKGEARAPAVPEAPQVAARRVYIVDKPGAAQSEIRIGWVGVARSTPDYFPLVVLNTLLGGSFTSRLNQNLREEHGYTYGAGSSFAMRLSPGPFVAGAAVETDKTAEAVAEFFKEFEAILEPVPAEELSRAKNYVALRFPGQFETTRDVASRLEELIVYGLPEGYYSQYVDEIQDVTAAAVQEAARKHLEPDRFAIVVVGDRKAIEGALAALDLGPIEVLAVEDVIPTVSAARE